MFLVGVPIRTSPSDVEARRAADGQRRPPCHRGMVSSRMPGGPKDLDPPMSTRLMWVPTILYSCPFVDVVLSQPVEMQPSQERIMSWRLFCVETGCDSAAASLRTTRGDSARNAAGDPVRSSTWSARLQRLKHSRLEEVRSRGGRTPFGNPPHRSRTGRLRHFVGIRCPLLDRSQPGSDRASSSGVSGTISKVCDACASGPAGCLAAAAVAHPRSAKQKIGRTRPMGLLRSPPKSWLRFSNCSESSRYARGHTGCEKRTFVAPPADRAGTPPPALPCSIRREARSQSGVFRQND